MLHTGKTKGTLGEVLPKVKTFRGAMRVITPEGRGVVLVDMGKPVASYLKAGETTYRTREAVAILESEPMAEYDLVTYDNDEFREAMGICAEEGLLLEEPRVPPGEQVDAAVSAGVQKGSGLLSQLLHRFSGKEKETPAASLPEPEVPGPTRKAEETPAPPPAPLQGSGPRVTGTGMPEPGPAASPAAPAEESELSAILKRLSRAKEERTATTAPATPAEAAPVPGAVPESELSAVMRHLSRAKEDAGPPPMPAQEGPPPVTQPAAGQREEDTLDEILRRYKSADREQAPVVSGVKAVTPLGRGKEIAGEVAEPSRVELGAMMKRITRLDIVSFKKEMDQVKSANHLPGSEEPLPQESPKGEQPIGPVTLPPTREVKPALEPTRPSSDIDDLKAFIRRLEAFEHETGDLVPDREPEPVEPREEPAVPAPREVPEITIRPGILAAKPVPEKGTSPAAATAAAAQKPEPPRFGEPREMDRKVERRPVILSETRPGAEKPSPEVIIQWKKDEPLSGAAAGPAEGAGMVQPEPPRRGPVILKREIDIRRVERRPERPRAAAPLLEERKIDKIMRQPGVIAVSVFQEGFAVQSVGRADFDQVAANAEDLLRAGTKIASDISIGSLQQIILESQGGKLIISPYGDLNICIFTEADANLGLIRVAIRSIQTE